MVRLMRALKMGATMISIAVAIVLGFLAIQGVSNTATLGANLWQLKSFSLVFLGTLMATVLQFPWYQWRHLIRWVWVAFRPRSHSFKKDIKTLILMSDDYKLSGVQVIPSYIKKNTCPFLANALTLLMDGASGEVIKERCEATIQAIQYRHESGIFFFEQMAKYAPGFGLLGTVIGLIQLLSAIHSPNELGAGMALALVTTFYGILLANVVFQPIAGRLMVLDRDETRHNTILMIGVMGIADHEPSLVINEKMMLMLHNQRMDT
jgi:chemotaxis protein MotA